MSKDPVNEPLLQAFDFAGVMAEKDKEYDSQTRAILHSFLDVMDSFDRCLDPLNDNTAMGDAQHWMKTFSLIRKQLATAFSKAGVTPISCLDQVVDPQLHEIVEVKTTNEVEEGVIIEEVKRGYEWNGALLRRPQVVIAKRSEEV